MKKQMAQIKSISHRFQKIFLGLFVAASLSGCGPNLVVDEVGGNEMGTNGYYSQGDSSGGYACPSEQNVLPPDDLVKDGTQRYFACKGTSSYTKILLRGYSSTDRTSCVFPVQFLDNERFVYKLDPYGAPMYLCYDAWSGNSAEVDFPFTNYNGVVMVDNSLRSQMSQCLVSGQNCPMHAIGRFR